MWGLTPRERLARIAGRLEIGFASGAGGGPMIANLDYVFEPHWLAWIAERPEHVMTLEGVPVLANLSAVEDRLRVSLAMKQGRPVEDTGALTLVPTAVPSVARLTPETAAEVEEAVFSAALGSAGRKHTSLFTKGALATARAWVRTGLSSTRLALLAVGLALLASFFLYRLDAVAAVPAMLACFWAGRTANGLAGSTLRRVPFPTPVWLLISAVWLLAAYSGWKA